MRPDQITRETALFGLLGDGLEKSSDPDMINRFFDGNGVDAFCSIFNIREEDMPFFLTQIKSKTIKALFVRPSHAAWCLEYLDIRDEVAEATGFIDAAVIENGLLRGMASAPAALMRDVRDKRVAILGNTPRAQAFALAAALAGAGEICLADDSLEELARTGGMIRSRSAAAITYERCAPGAMTGIASADVVVNTLALGESMRIRYPEQAEVYDLTGSYPAQKARKYVRAEMILLSGVSFAVNQVLKIGTGVDERYADGAEITEIF